MSFTTRSIEPRQGCLVHGRECLARQASRGCPRSPMVVGSYVTRRVWVCDDVKRGGGKGLTSRVGPVRYLAGLYRSFGWL